jgi:hypothetical protein
MIFTMCGEYLPSSINTMNFVTKRHCAFCEIEHGFFRTTLLKRRLGFAGLRPNGSMVAKLRTGYRYQYSFYLEIL